MLWATASDEGATASSGRGSGSAGPGCGFPTSPLLHRGRALRRSGRPSRGARKAPVNNTGVTAVESQIAPPFGVQGAYPSMSAPKLGFSLPARRGATVHVRARLDLG